MSFSFGHMNMYRFLILFKQIVIYIYIYIDCVLPIVNISYIVVERYVLFL